MFKKLLIFAMLLMATAFGQYEILENVKIYGDTLTFTGSTMDNGFDTFFKITNPTADRTILFPDSDLDFSGGVVSQEVVDDWVDALFNDADAVNTLITVTYDDADNAMDLVVDNDLANYDNSSSGFLTANETITISGDADGTGTTAITLTIASDAIEESMLKSVNTPADEDIVTYELTTGDFEYHTPGELGLLTGNETITLSSEATGSGTTSIAVTLDNDALDDQYVELGDAFIGDVTGPYSATVVGDDSHAHGSGTITEADPLVDTEGEIEAILGIAFGTSKVVTDDYILVADGTDFESVAMSGEATINNGVVTIASSIHDDEYVELTDAFIGDVTGAYSATVVGDDSHDHGSGTITEVDPTVDTEGEIETILGIAFGTSKTATDDYILVGDGTDFESVAMSGEATINNGVVTLDNDALDDQYYDAEGDLTTLLDDNYQPLEATLTDIADGTIAENLVNTANPWASNEIVATVIHESELAALETDPLVDTEAEIEAILGIAFGTSKTATDDYMLVGDGTDFESVAISGEATMNNGVITLDNDALDDQYYDAEGDLTTLLDDNYQPLEATLTDIADGTIAENLVNTANPWAANEITEADPLALLTAGTNNVKDTHIDWGTGASQVSTHDIPIALGSGSPTIDQLQERIDNVGSSGFFTGGTISDGGSGTVDVAAGEGFIRTTNDFNAELQSFKWSASAGIAVTDNTTQYIYVDDDGAISLSTDEFLETPDKIIIGVVTDEAAAIVNTFNMGVRLDESIGQAGRFIRRVHGIERDKRKGGLAFGSSDDANREVTITAGTLWWGRTEYDFSAFDTGVASTFETYSAGGQEATGVTAWPNDEYDNAGTLTVLTNNRWMNLYFFIEPNETVVMVYGREEYISQALAEDEAVPTTSLPTKISETGVLASRFTIQEGVNTAVVASAFAQLFSGAGGTDHGNLSGLDDGDHDAVYYTETEIDAGFQPLDAQLTDLADGTLTGDFVNTANPWAENEIVSTVIVESEINTFAELQAFSVDKTLVNEEDVFTIEGNWVNTDNPWAANEIVSTVVHSSELAGEETDPNVDTESEIEAITGALFGTSKAVTSGYIWVADGTDYEGVAMSGDVGIATGGATTIQANSVDGTMIAMGSDVQGDVMFYNGTNWARLGYGNDGEVLHTKGIGADPIWDTDDGAGAAGTISAIEEETVQVGGSDITLINFHEGFDITEPVDTEITVTLDLSEITAQVVAEEADPNVDTEGEIEAILGIAFGASKAVTDDYILVADGTDFESVAMSGEATINNGVITLDDDALDDQYYDAEGDLTDLLDNNYHPLTTLGIANLNLVDIDDADAADNDYAKFTANGLEGRSYAEAAGDLESEIVSDLADDYHPLTTLGIADNNLMEVDDADAASTDVAYFTANGLAGYSESEFKTAYNMEAGTDFLAEQTIGIADDNLLEVDDADNLAVNDYAKVTANGIVGRTYAQTAGDLESEIVSDLADDYQPLEATLTDIADGTIAENLVNTANPWAADEIVSTVVHSSELAGEESDPNVDSEAEIEAITGALFGASKAVTDDYIWVADGTDFEAVAVSGDITMNNGVVAVVDDSHNHIYSDIDGFDESNLYTLLSDVSQFYEAGDDIAAADFGLLELTKSITIESPAADEDITWFFTNVAITITEIRAVLSLGADTPSVTWTIRHHASDRANAGAEVVTSGTTTTSITTGDDVTSFNDATIPADSFVWVETTAMSGTVPELALTIGYTED